MTTSQAVEEEQQENVGGSGSGKMPPAYGSKDYWEQRYARVGSNETQATTTATPSEDDPASFFSWYFSYEELKPIILPLVLGGRQEMERLCGDSSQEGQDCKRASETTKHSNGEKVTVADRDKTPTTTTENSKEQENVTEDEEEDEWEEVGSDDGEEESESESVDAVSQLESGLAVDGPISILEIGCGDVPLGCGLAEDMGKLKGKSDANNFVDRIICTDYSRTVIEMMQRGRQKKRKTTATEGDKSCCPIEFQVADARNLPYQDGSFHLIFEKGTMDAMISDTEVGVANCIKIISDGARVLAVGGCFFIVSHINAHTAKGQQWLEDVVLVGLRQGGDSYSWSIEVHGAEPDCEDNNDENDDDKPTESPGPAVYLIFKKPSQQDKEKTDNPDTIPLQFFAY